jgi:hypothetical protein
MGWFLVPVEDSVVHHCVNCSILLCKFTYPAMYCTLVDLNESASSPEMRSLLHCLPVACSLVSSSLPGRISTGLDLTRDWASKKLSLLKNHTFDSISMALGRLGTTFRNVAWTSSQCKLWLRGSRIGALSHYHQCQSLAQEWLQCKGWLLGQWVVSREDHVCSNWWSTLCCNAHWASAVHSCTKCTTPHNWRSAHAWIINYACSVLITHSLLVVSRQWPTSKCWYNSLFCLSK